MVYHVCHAFGAMINCHGFIDILDVWCRDRTKPNSWVEPVDLTILPEEGTLEPSIGEKVVDWFDGVRGKKKAPA